MSDNFFKEQDIFNEITNMASSNHQFMGRLINHINHFYEDKEIKARELSGKYYLSCALLMSVILQRKSVKLSEIELNCLNASLPPISDTDCPAFKLFHERFNIHGGENGKD